MRVLIVKVSDDLTDEQMTQLINQVVQLPGILSISLPIELINVMALRGRDEEDKC